MLHKCKNGEMKIGTFSSCDVYFSPKTVVPELLMKEGEINFRRRLSEFRKEEIFVGTFDRDSRMN